jgi:hypothetical protein
MARRTISQDKSFELTGCIQRINAGVGKNGDAYIMVSVSGFVFFLPEDWFIESNEWDEGQKMIVKGLYAGDSIRAGGARQPQFELTEMYPAPSVTTSSTNGHSPVAETVPRLSKAAPS